MYMACIGKASSILIVDYLVQVSGVWSSNLVLFQTRCGFSGAPEIPLESEIDCTPWICTPSILLRRSRRVSRLVSELKIGQDWCCMLWVFLERRRLLLDNSRLFFGVLFPLYGRLQS